MGKTYLFKSNICSFKTAIKQETTTNATPKISNFPNQFAKYNTAPCLAFQNMGILVV